MTKKFTITVEGDGIKKIFSADQWRYQRNGGHVYADGVNRPVAYLPDAGITLELGEVTYDTSILVQPSAVGAINALDPEDPDYLGKLRLLVQAARVYFE